MRFFCWLAVCVCVCVALHSARLNVSRFHFNVTGATQPFAPQPIDNFKAGFKMFTAVASTKNPRVHCILIAYGTERGVSSLIRVYFYF